VTLLLTGWVCKQAPRLGLLDRPTQARNMHMNTIPTGGGLAIAVGLAVGLGLLRGFWGPFPGTLQSLMFWVGAALMLATGYWDDKYVLDAKGKFSLQLVAAYLLLHSGAALPLSELGAGSLAREGSTVPLPFEAALYVIPLSMIWIIGIINAVNLIDGLDGLATGILGIAFLACAALFGVKGEMALMAVGVTMTGALIGFLPHNYEPASVFMGDSGSLFLGYLLAGYTLQGPLHSDPGIALLILLTLLGVPVLDTGTAIVRRLVSDRSIFAPDRHHIHHCLVGQESEQRAVLVLYGVGGWFGSAAVLMGVLPAVWAYALAGGTAVVSLVWAWRLGALTPVPARKEPAEQQSAERFPLQPADAPSVGETTPVGGDGMDPEAVRTRGVDERDTRPSPAPPPQE